MIFCLCIFLAYLLGSIPFGFLLTQLISGFDIRSTGSGNIGATNVLRSGHKFLALITLTLDSLKGAMAVLIYQYVETQYPILWHQSFGSFQFNSFVCVLIIATAVIVGHIFSIFLKFKGGKGIATLGGCLFALSWPVGLGVTFIWLSVFIFSQKSALAGLIAALGLPMIAYFYSGTILMIWSLGIVLLIIYTHRTNIFRLWQKKELKIDLNSSKTSS